MAAPLPPPPQAPGSAGSWRVSLDGTWVTSTRTPDSASRDARSGCACSSLPQCLLNGRTADGLHIDILCALVAQACIAAQSRRQDSAACWAAHSDRTLRALSSLVRANSADALAADVVCAYLPVGTCARILMPTSQAGVQAALQAELQIAHLQGRTQGARAQRRQVDLGAACAQALQFRHTYLTPKCNASNQGHWAIRCRPATGWQCWAWQTPLPKATRLLSLTHVRALPD